MAGAVAEQQVRLAEVSRLVAAHVVRKANDLAETRQHTAALQTQLTALAQCASEATGTTAAASEAGLQVRAGPDIRCVPGTLMLRCLAPFGCQSSRWSA